MAMLYLFKNPQTSKLNQAVALFNFEELCALQKSIVCLQGPLVHAAYVGIFASSV